MKIKVQIIFLSCVIGRRSMCNTASSLWPGQKYYLNLYHLALVFLILAVVSVTPAWCEGKTGSADSPAAAESAAPDSGAPMTDIHDILPPVPVGLEAPWLWIGLIALGVVLLAALAWRLYKNVRKARSIETIVPELPPELIARQALDQLSDFRGMDGKTFYFRLSAILRHYVFGRFGVGAPEMTTEEFLPCIDSLSIDTDLSRGLKTLCRAMDPVKFGGQKTAEKQMETDLFFAREFVRKTTQQLNMENENKYDEPIEIISMEDENSKKQIPNLK